MSAKPPEGQIKFNDPITAESAIRYFERLQGIADRRGYCLMIAKMVKRRSIKNKPLGYAEIRSSLEGLKQKLGPVDYPELEHAFRHVKDFATNPAVFQPGWYNVR